MQTWEKTKVQCLVRHLPSGTYYARVRAGGKLIWRTLKTDQFTVAKARLPETLGEIRKGSSRPCSFRRRLCHLRRSGRGYLSNVERKVGLKPRSIDYQREIVAALLKSWPQLGAAKLKAVTARQCLWIS